MPRLRRIGALALVLLLATIGLIGIGGSVASGGLSAGKVLILESSFSASGAYNERDAAEAQGFTVDVVDDAAWAAMTTADFAAYRAIIFADPNCVENGGEALGAALDSLATWVPAVTGNLVVHTFDPLAHEPHGDELLDRAIAWATGVDGQTGMYISTSCYNGPSVDDLLNAVASGWTFVPEEASDGNWCDNVHVVGTNPALDGLTDDELSGWGCSTHGFFSTWPTTFSVFAIVSEDDTGQASGQVGTQADDDVEDPPACGCVPDDFTAPDSTVGSPALLVRAAAVPAVPAPPVTPPVVVTPTFTG